MNYKKNNYFILITILTLISFLLSGYLFYPPATTVGFILKTVQNVSYKAADTEDWSKAKTGTTLNNGDEIKTGVRSLALVKFKDSSLLRVRENSILKIFGEQLNKKFNKNTEIDEGVVGFNVSKQLDEEFKFTTPTMVASIRGTEGYFKVDNENSRLYVEEGKIEIESRFGSHEKRMVEKGFTANVGFDGVIKIAVASQEDLKLNEESKKVKTTKVIIKTSADEEYILEYLDK